MKNIILYLLITVITGAGTIVAIKPSILKFNVNIASTFDFKMNGGFELKQENNIEQIQKKINKKPTKEKSLRRQKRK